MLSQHCAHVLALATDEADSSPTGAPFHTLQPAIVDDPHCRDVTTITTPSNIAFPQLPRAASSRKLSRPSLVQRYSISAPSPTLLSNQRHNTLAAVLPSDAP
jgi:hypothetical protein